MITLNIPGIPVAKQRPRLSKYGTYTPEKTINYESLVQMCYMDQADGVKLEGPLEISIDFHFPIPQSYTKAARNKIKSGLMLHTKKPDIDNCIKTITDALNQFAYKDDSQIVSVIARKHYTDAQPRAQVKLREIDTQKISKGIAEMKKNYELQPSEMDRDINKFIL